MVQRREAIEGAWAQVENQLQRRNDLVPNLVETTKGYAAHEKDIFTSLANARSRMLTSTAATSAWRPRPSCRARCRGCWRSPSATRISKANQQFARLSDELAGTENRIAVERMRYNDAVRAYNEFIKSFPHLLYASAAGFKPLAYFAAPPEAKQVPKVDFGTGAAAPTGQ
ncbi:MAG: LemA family protein [Candidatus Binatia bacterium]